MEIHYSPAQGLRDSGSGLRKLPGRKILQSEREITLPLTIQFNLVNLLFSCKDVGVGILLYGS